MSTNFPTSLDNTDSQKVTDGSSVIVAALPNNLLDMVEALEAKVGVDGSAVATSHDYLLANKGAFADGDTVFNTKLTAANTWQDLDLSSYVGAKVALVYLEIRSSGISWFAVKPKGYGSATFGNHYQAEGSGASACWVNNVKVVYLVCMTDASGVLQIGNSSTSNTITIKLVGHVK